MTEALRLTEGEAIIIAQEYFEVMETLYEDGWVSEERLLPYPKCFIEHALLCLLGAATRKEVCEGFAQGLLRLANWQEGVGMGPVKIEQTDWAPIVAAERNRLVQELKDMGLW